VGQDSWVSCVRNTKDRDGLRPFCDWKQHVYSKSMIEKSRNMKRDGLQVSK